MQFEIIDNGDKVTHFFRLGDIVTLVQTDTDGTARYTGDIDGYELEQWVGNADVKEVV